jgi:hypothetical protein
VSIDRILQKILYHYARTEGKAPLGLALAAAASIGRMTARGGGG